MTIRRRCVAAGLALAALSGCDHFAVDPGTRVVAEVGGASITAAQLQSFLDANQFQDPAADPLSPGDASRVKSRLFDDFLDGEILLQEAKRRDVTVSDSELAEYLGPGAPADGAKRELARRDLIIQKLRESVVREAVRVQEHEVDAWLAARAQGGAPALRGTLRTLRLASYPEAVRVRQEIVSKKMSFTEAEMEYGADSIPDAPRNEDLAALPQQIAVVVKSLQPGNVSPPLPFESSVLLFLLEPEDPTGATESRRREGARRAIALEKAKSVGDDLLAGLRKKVVVTRHVKELPFAYVAEDAAPRPK